LNFDLIVPELSVLATAVVVILVNLFSSKKRWLYVVSLAGLAVAGGFTISYWGKAGQVIMNNMLAVDQFALFFKLLFLAIAALVVLASVSYTSKFSDFKGEYLVLVLISTLGMMLMASATELISLFISLELTSLPLYALAGFLKTPKSTESALKYFLIGAISSAIFLYGMIFIFGFTGTTQLNAIGDAVRNALGGAGSTGLLLGIVLIITGACFKIAAFPFHMWAPDVYEGAPTPVTAYVSVASKSAGFAIIMRIFFASFNTPAWLSHDWGMTFAILAVIGMTAGNLWAIPQTNIKRMMGYSSIAQAGYLMLGLATMGLSVTGTPGQSGLLFFLSGYSITNLGAFFAIITISEKIGSDNIDDFSGMGKKSPLLALALSFCLISLIGIPPTVGFMAKFYLFSAAAQQNLLWLVIIAVINSVISAYYYLRVVKVMWLDEAKLESTPAVSSPSLNFAIAVSCLAVLVLGIAPRFLIKLAEIAAGML